MSNRTISEIQTHRPVTPHTILSARMLALKDQLIENQAAQIHLEALEQCLELIVPLDGYIAQHSTPPSKVLDDLEANTDAIDWEAAYENGETTLQLEKEMVSGAVEGQFLKILIALCSAKRVLEIGAFTGYASLAMAEALPDDGKLIACEYDAYAADFAQQQWNKSPHAHKMEVRVGDAQQTLQALAEESTVFDFVFLDADKENYLHYYNSLLDEGLVKTGSLICVDNTLYMGQVYGATPSTKNGAALQVFNEAVRDDSRVEQVLLPLRDGITLIRRK
ncbi:MAG: class I SAM-dependent methyltransferase [Bacteroidota bacterium]